ncbi:MAG: hypothetical protein AB8H80_08235 [Planctomycetota bacterium]
MKYTPAAFTLGCLLLAGCDGSKSRSIEVGGVALASTAGGTVPVEIWLFDFQSDPVDVELSYSTDGRQSFEPATVTSNTAGLATSPLGRRHTLEWDALTDLGARASLEVSLSVQATDPLTGNRSLAFVTSFNLENLESASDQVESYMIYFGPVDEAKVAIAETHDLVILYSCDPTITRAVIAEIQDGIDPEDPRDDVIVLGYVNVGEDERTIGVSDNDLLLDPRFVGDGTGPRLDPRGPGAAGQALTDLDPLGIASTSAGYASWFLDDNSLESNGVGDGVPDRNGVTGACYANMGDPMWLETLDAMQCASTDQRNGFRELLTLDYGLGLGCDGVYLDNVDTCAPNTFTGPGDPDQAEFEWTAAGYTDMVEELRTRYPRALLMQNRGLFFFSPDLPHYAITPRTNLDFVKVESYRLDRQASVEFDDFTFADNKFNFVPKLQAEAYREDGFQVLSLGYAEGPGIDYDTLLGTSTAGLATLQEDLFEAQQLAGFRHYIADSGGQIVNSFVRERSDFADTTPPVWTSTFNDNQPGFPTPPLAPTARVGIQEVVPESQAVTVRWDVALDLNPVTYRLYYQEQAFDFAASNPLANATQLDLNPEVGTGYANGTSATVYANEATVTDLETDTSYWFCIRAYDSQGNEDSNQVALQATTGSQERLITIDGDFSDWNNVPRVLRDRRTNGTSAGPDWRNIKMVRDNFNVYVYFTTYEAFELSGTPFAESQLKIYIDCDNDPFTGFRFSNVGSELMVRGDELVSQQIGVEDAGTLQTIEINPTSGIRECELAIPFAQIDAAAGQTATSIRILLRNQDGDDLAPDSGYFLYRFRR